VVFERGRDLVSDRADAEGGCRLLDLRVAGISLRRG
jgi:hypothetical protein